MFGGWRARGGSGPRSSTICTSSNMFSPLHQTPRTRQHRCGQLASCQHRCGKLAELECEYWSSYTGLHRGGCGPNNSTTRIFSNMFSPLHLTPYTLHPTPYNLHATPCARHPAPCTLHPAPCTLHPTLCTLHPAPDTLHPTPYTIHPTP